MAERFTITSAARAGAGWETKSITTWFTTPPTRRLSMRAFEAAHTEARAFIWMARRREWTCRTTLSYRVAGDVVYVPEGMKNGLPPHVFNNNILAFGRLSIFKKYGRPWWYGCEGATLRAKITHNIFYFDRDSSSGFFPSTDAPTLAVCRRTSFTSLMAISIGGRTKFWQDPKAFHVQKSEPRDAAGCIAPQNPDNAWQYLTLKEWQGGSRVGTAPSVGEDVSSTVTVNPGFGNSGQPSDFLLSKNPMPGFDFTKTNDTIHNAGRNHPVIMPPTVPATFPTYNFTSF